MNTQSRHQDQHGPGFERIFIGLGVILLMIGKTMLKCTDSPIVKMREFWIYSFVTIASLSFVLTYQNDHLKNFYNVSNGIMGIPFQRYLESFSSTQHYLIMNGAIWFGLLFSIGLFAQFRRRKYENLTQNVGIRNSNGQHPKLKAVVHHKGGEKTSILYSANGIGLGDFTSKRSNIALMIGEKIEDITEDAAKRHIEILINNGEFPRVLHYQKVKQHLTKPYSFVVGHCKNKVHTQDIRKLPHLMVAGTTSNGKSNFLKNVMLGLLESSDRIQLKVVDLKKGVEMAKFSGFNNIEIAKNENDASLLLANLVGEMHKRYNLMHEKGISQFDAKILKKDIVVLIIDEASVIFDKTGLNGQKKIAVERARNHTDELTKLARAAGIHVIVATQKVTKESVDSRIQANIGGWMCFKVANDIASRLVLESGLASKLPKVAGRGIWKTGNNLVEVQAPLVADRCLEEELEGLRIKFNCVYPKPAVSQADD